MSPINTAFRGYSGALLPAGYAADIEILRNLSLSIEAGRITGLIGLNGAGKSTLILAGREFPA